MKIKNQGKKAHTQLGKCLVCNKPFYYRKGNAGKFCSNKHYLQYQNKNSKAVLKVCYAKDCGCKKIYKTVKSSTTSKAGKKYTSIRHYCKYHYEKLLTLMSTFQKEQFKAMDKNTAEIMALLGEYLPKGKKWNEKLTRRVLLKILFQAGIGLKNSLEINERFFSTKGKRGFDMDIILDDLLIALEWKNNATNLHKPEIQEQWDRQEEALNKDPNYKKYEHIIASCDGSIGRYNLRSLLIKIESKSAKLLAPKKRKKAKQVLGFYINLLAPASFSAVVFDPS